MIVVAALVRNAHTHTHTTGRWLILYPNIQNKRNILGNDMITTVQAEPFWFLSLCGSGSGRSGGSGVPTKMKHQLLLRSKIMRIRSIRLHFIEFNTCISGHLTFFFGRCTGLKECNARRLLLLITTLIHPIFLVLYGAIPTSLIKQQNIYTSGTVGWYFRSFPFEFSCKVFVQVPGLITGGYPPVI